MSFVHRSRSVCTKSTVQAIANCGQCVLYGLCALQVYDVFFWCHYIMHNKPLQSIRKLHSGITYQYERAAELLLHDIEIAPPQNGNGILANGP